MQEEKGPILVTNNSIIETKGGSSLEEGAVKRTKFLIKCNKYTVKAARCFLI